MTTEKEKMLSEQLYQASDATLKADMKRARQLTRLFNTSTEEQLDYRTTLLKQLFAKTGEQLYIEPNLRCDYGSNITVGDAFYANYDCVLLDVAPITIGENVMFGPRVSLLTASHPLDATVRISGLEYGEAITIGDNVWLGGSVTVNPGVTIGANTIIGSGSVVTKTIPANVIAAGNPCRVIRELTVADQQLWEAKQAAYWADYEND